jgi:hypothetical protein
MFHHDLRHTGLKPGLVSADLTCLPETGTVPFAVTLTCTLTNKYSGFVRRIAGHVDVTLANGDHYSYYRAGYTNVHPTGSTVVSWVQYLSGSPFIGTNAAHLVVEDVTPSPYNLPPYPPAGDTDMDSCTVIGIAP